MISVIAASPEKITVYRAANRSASISRNPGVLNVSSHGPCRPVTYPARSAPFPVINRTTRSPVPLFSRLAAMGARASKRRLRAREEINHFFDSSVFVALLST